MNETATNPRPRIFRVSVQRSDGSRRSRIIKAPYWEREPKDSLFGLTARLDEAVMTGHVLSYTIRVPDTLTPTQRTRLTRWPAVIDALVEESE